MHEDNGDSFLPHGWKRQSFQSLCQFVIVLLTSLATAGERPTDFDAWWPHLIGAALAAAGIWVASKASVGGKE